MIFIKEWDKTKATTKMKKKKKKKKEFHPYTQAHACRMNVSEHIYVEEYLCVCKPNACALYSVSVKQLL